MISDSKLPPAQFVLTKILVQALGQVLRARDTGEQQVECIVWVEILALGEKKLQ